MSFRSASTWQRLKAATVSSIYSLTKKCLTCQHLSHDRTISKVDLVASARLGCRYCIFILNAFNHFDAQDDFSKVSWMNDWCTLSFRYNEPHRSWLQLEVYTPVGHPPAWPDISQSADPLDDILNGGSPRSPEAYGFIHSCLQDCDDNHPECKIAGQELPTRLLDVRHEGTQQVMLVETRSLPMRHRATYIALSYCWGKGQSLTLRSENLEAMKLGLMVSSLPQTLQDAVTVARALGQQYLWVDALCIIQNSPSDWEVESSRLASVYRGAWLTIAAAAASGASEGFLSRNYRETNRWYKEPYHEKWPNHEACSAILGARWASQYLEHRNTNTKIPVPSWNLRGWTMQERLLSQRLLTYHLYELRWVCQTTSKYESTSHSPYLEHWLKADPLDRPLLKYKSVQAVHDRWRSIVLDYTARRLTDVRDKLPAISGLAQVFQRVLQSPYIAGIWKNQLPWDLLWTASSLQVNTAPELYIAPTFSWASISSPVERFVEKKPFRHSESVSQIVVEDACAIVDGKDPLGRVNNGWIKLRGYISKATLGSPDDLKWYYPVKTKYLGIRIFDHDTFLEEFQATNEQGNVERSVCRMRRPSSATPQDNEPLPPIIQHGAVVYLLFMGYRRDVIPPTFTSYYFLVLGISRENPGMYERLGVLEELQVWKSKSRSKEEEFISGLISAADEYKTITIV
ncbi:HET-domain-containing protein [Pseudoneurospora amorphoporcata]|uniref:HET-domain-containing protein n=1 Tax=Pseudoneurospora amorphoporcata TaxID=241081 RepID=A0AAN6NZ64_9PEZI|nr:HET-domain-containing protein [Pseudoneurospora amorphoporcata]